MLKNSNQWLCLFCGNPFVPYRDWQKYCSPTHRKMAWFALNPEKHRESSRKSRRKSLEANYKAVIKWKSKNLDKVQANIQARNIRLGSQCEVCGAKENLVKHHPDYSKPLEVLTLCRLCHKKVHKEDVKR